MQQCVSTRRNTGVIAELTDMRLPAAFVCGRQTSEIKPVDTKMASPGRIAFSESWSSGRIMRNPSEPRNARRASNAACSQNGHGLK
jgi:hypothetical protein